MKIASDVLAVLAGAVIEGVALRLPAQVDPNLYTRVDKALQAAGGRWDRKAQAHVFPEAPGPAIQQMCSTGELVTAQDFGYFPTPAAVVKRLVELAHLSPGLTVLEPSAGRGAIARQAAAAGCAVDCVELLEDNVQALVQAGIARSVTHGDFLDLAPSRQYDRVIMNPPFAGGADIAHVTHAYDFLAPDGLLVAVMASGVTFHSTRAARQFRALVERTGGMLEELPDKAFQESGTLMRTVVVVLPGRGRRWERPEPAAEPMVRTIAAAAQEELRSPAAIVQEIIRDLAEAQRHMQALQRDLERPLVSRQSCEQQLSFDL
ncbi:methyltransferase [Streptomyces sp. IBSNAI002]|uniref:methyltransferase n=1 Tax=Streptomyces sp. IBSNAI002 TaxID=3457500 RepID=UPI003FD1721E